MRIVKKFISATDMLTYLNGGKVLFSSTVAAITGTDTITVSGATMSTVSGVTSSNYVWVSGQEPGSANNFQGAFPITNVTDTVLTVANATNIGAVAIRVVTSAPVDPATVETFRENNLWVCIVKEADNAF